MNMAEATRPKLPVLATKSAAATLLATMQYILCIASNAMYYMHCIQCNVFQALHSRQCSKCIAYYASCSMHCIHCILCIRCDAYCILQILFYELRFVHCVPYTILYALLRICSCVQQLKDWHHQSSLCACYVLGFFKNALHGEFVVIIYIIYNI